MARKKRPTVSTILIALPGAATIVGHAHADGYNYTSVSVPGAKGIVANGINNLGQIVGFYFDTNGGIHGLVQTNGSVVNHRRPVDLEFDPAVRHPRCWKDCWVRRLSGILRYQRHLHDAE